jgi:hypothetical protein
MSDYDGSSHSGTGSWSTTGSSSSYSTTGSGSDSGESVGPSVNCPICGLCLDHFNANQKNVYVFTSNLFQTPLGTYHSVLTSLLTMVAPKVHLLLLPISKTLLLSHMILPLR